MPEITLLKFTRVIYDSQLLQTAFIVEIKHKLEIK